MTRTNELGQLIGEPVPDWQQCEAPSRSILRGRSCILEPADPDRHAESLWEAVKADSEGRLWTYLPYGPFADFNEYRDWMVATCLAADPLFLAIVERQSGRAIGLASYLRIVPQVGVIEVGHLQFSPGLQRTTAATEAMYLMMHRVFEELGYRRYEWKCDALNRTSRRAAERLGFRFEGVFRQATLYKGRSRDTAWYSILDSEWPALDASFQNWLSPENFDADGRQIAALSNLHFPARAAEETLRK